MNPAGGSGQPWWVQAEGEILGTALLCPKPLSQSHLEFCRGVNTFQVLPTSWFCHLLVSAGEGGDVKLSSPFSSGDDDRCIEASVFSGRIFLNPGHIIPL